MKKLNIEVLSKPTCDFFDMVQVGMLVGYRNEPALKKKTIACFGIVTEVWWCKPLGITLSIFWSDNRTISYHENYSDGLKECIEVLGV